MTVEYRSDSKKHSKRLQITLIIVAIILLAAAAMWNVLTESTYTILRDKVLVNKETLNGAKILSQQKDERGRDSYLSLHAVLTAAAAKEMSQQDVVIKECANRDNLEKCTKPTWISYEASKNAYPLATPTVSDDVSSIKCTSYWASLTSDGSTNSQDVICLRGSNGELWYVFSKI